MAETSEGVIIARITRAWGIRGEAIADVLTDFPDRFRAVGDVTLRRGGAGRKARLQGHRFHKGRVLLKFEGVDTMNDAEGLVGYDVVVSDAERVEIPEGEDLFFESDLVGCEVVTREGERVGEVEGFLKTGGGVLLSVRRDDGREALVPFVDEICVDVDLGAKRVVVELPEGLLDL
jgi:16S rRNA processing protein RimM